MPPDPITRTQNRRTQNREPLGQHCCGSLSQFSRFPVIPRGFRMRTSSLLAFAMWLVILASPALAQAPAADRRIEVTVLDSQGLPIYGAQVTATLPVGNLSRTGASSSE